MKKALRLIVGMLAFLAPAAAIAQQPTQQELLQALQQKWLEAENYSLGLQVLINRLRADNESLKARLQKPTKKPDR